MDGAAVDLFPSLGHQDSVFEHGSISGTNFSFGDAIFYQWEVPLLGAQITVLQNKKTGHATVFSNQAPTGPSVLFYDFFQSDQVLPVDFILLLENSFEFLRLFSSSLRGHLYDFGLHLPPVLLVLCLHSQ